MKHHPASVDLELVKRLIATTGAGNLQKFLAIEFTSISRDLAGEHLHLVAWLEFIQMIAGAGFKPSDAITQVVTLCSRTCMHEPSMCLPYHWRPRILTSAHSSASAGRLIDEMRSGATPDMAPGKLGQPQVVRLHQLLHEARFADPDGGHLSPAGSSGSLRNLQSVRLRNSF